MSAKSLSSTIYSALAHERHGSIEHMCIPGGSKLDARSFCKKTPVGLEARKKEIRKVS